MLEAVAGKRRIDAIEIVVARFELSLPAGRVFDLLTMESDANVVDRVLERDEYAFSQEYAGELVARGYWAVTFPSVLAMDDQEPELELNIVVWYGGPGQLAPDELPPVTEAKRWRVGEIVPDERATGTSRRSLLRSLRAAGKRAGRAVTNGARHLLRGRRS
jgi:hypothetical protein